MMKPKWLYESNLRPKWHLENGLSRTRIELVYLPDGEVMYHQPSARKRMVGGNTSSWSGKDIKHDFHKAIRSDDDSKRRSRIISRKYSELHYFGT
jgi:hypothetical protein